MILNRRMTMAGLGTVLLFSACIEQTATLALRAQGSPGMNPGPDGQDRPVTLTVVQMSGTGAFDGADFFALQNPQAALGGDFVSAQQLVVAPGGSAAATITIQPTATAVGIVAGFRNPAGKVFRLKTPAPSGEAGAIVSVGPGGIAMTSV